MTTDSRIDAKLLNEFLDPEDVLKLIGYPGSNPKRSGGELRDCCPIHGETRKKGEKGGDLAINEAKKTFCCHSNKCNSRGDLINLYQAAKNITFPQAIEELSKYFNIHPLSSSKEGYMSKVIEKPAEKKPIKSVIEIWGQANATGKHEYLEKKKIVDCPGIKIGKNLGGYNSVFVPYYSIDGDMKTIQYISDKLKIWHIGTSPTGCFFPLGSISDSTTLYICEGFATAYTVWKAIDEKHTVVSVGSAGNLEAVVNLLHQKYPGKEIIIASDGDAAGQNPISKIEFPCKQYTPNFEGMSWDGDKKPKDFNDLVSMCNQPLSVVQDQLKKEIQIALEPLYSKLGKVLKDPIFAQSLENRSYNVFEEEHKRLYSAGGLITGFNKLDDQVYFSKGDLVIIQAMSNHGKSTFMLQLAYQFLREKNNQDKDPLCIFITYESSPLRIEEKFLNIMSNLNNEGTILQYHNKSEEKYLYPDRRDCRRTITEFNRLLHNQKINILKRIPIEDLPSVIDVYKKHFPSRTIVLFLDYIQIIENNSKSDGWDRIKEISYNLETLAIKEEIIVFTASQVNDKRQSREGRDIYNAATTVIDVLNHSHDSLKLNEDGKKLFKEKLNGENLCSLSVIKQKHGSSFDLGECMLFNGFCFKEKEKLDGNTSKLSMGKKNEEDNKIEQEKGHFDEFRH